MTFLFNHQDVRGLRFRRTAFQNLCPSRLYRPSSGKSHRGERPSGHQSVPVGADGGPGRRYPHSRPTSEGVASDGAGSCRRRAGETARNLGRVGKLHPMWILYPHDREGESRGNLRSVWPPREAEERSFPPNSIAEPEVLVCAGGSDPLPWHAPDSRKKTVFTWASGFWSIWWPAGPRGASPKSPRPWGRLFPARMTF